MPHHHFYHSRLLLVLDDISHHYCITYYPSTEWFKTTNTYYLFFCHSEFKSNLAVWLLVRVSNEAAVKMSVGLQLSGSLAGAHGLTSKVTHVTVGRGLSPHWLLAKDLGSLPCRLLPRDSEDPSGCGSRLPQSEWFDKRETCKRLMRFTYKTMLHGTQLFMRLLKQLREVWYLEWKRW